MRTPIIMLILMTSPWLAALALNTATGRRVDPRRAAAAGMGLLFLFTATGHFVLTAPMVQMLPPWIPARQMLVHATGVLELLIALAFFIPRFIRHAGMAAIAVLVLFFPANIYAAFNHVPMGGHEWGPAYLLLRAPLQGVVIAWAYWFTLARPSATALLQKKSA